MKIEKRHRYVSRYGPSLRPDPPVDQAIAAATNANFPVRAPGMAPAALATDRLLAVRELAASPRR
jgi:hypothetical protein